MSENEKKFERMYWKKVQECKLLEGQSGGQSGGQSERQSSETTHVDEISSIQYVNHDRKFGRLTYQNLYFNHNSSDIDINLIDNTTKVYFKVIESYDTHFSNQAYILGIHQPLSMDMFPKLQLLSSNSSTSTTDIDSECSSEECNINKNITQLQLKTFLSTLNPELFNSLPTLYATILKQKTETLTQWKLQNNYLSDEEHTQKINELINTDCSNFDEEHLKTHLKKIKTLSNHKNPEIPKELIVNNSDFNLKSSKKNNSNINSLVKDETLELLEISVIPISGNRLGCPFKCNTRRASVDTMVKHLEEGCNRRPSNTKINTIKCRNEANKIEIDNQLEIIVGKMFGTDPPSQIKKNI